MLKNHFPKEEQTYENYLATLAVAALIEEANLTPKPGLVDQQSPGSHSDMNINTMICSAYALQDTFSEMASSSFDQQPSQSLRQQLASIGQEGERRMFKATSGINTHKGAIWALGLLISATAIHGPNGNVRKITQTAGKIALYPLQSLQNQETNGSKARKRYGVSGAIGEAQEGFPHITEVALPTLKDSREKGMSEQEARIDTLLALMASLDDTCILYRGGSEALSLTKTKAKTILEAGGASTEEGKKKLHLLDQTLVSLGVSPGGSADLLAATLFLDWVCS